MKKPHSREKRINNIHSSVNKQSFNSDNDTSSPKKGFSSGGYKQRKSPFFFNSSFGSNSGFYKQQKKPSLFKILLIILMIVLIINLFKSLFSNNVNQNNTINEPSVNVNQTSDTSNAYLTNHTVEHVSDTSTENVNYSVNADTRKKFTSIVGDNKDEVTVMVYIIGSDLESGYGAATKDINEMLHSNMADNINIILETGGTRRWNNNVMSNRYLERYSLTSEGLYRLDTKISNTPMTNPETLTSFIKYSADNFPANRYMLILWDHGGGSVAGYGYDENYPYEGSMSPDMIAKALADSNIKFDFVGFDACLMSNLETALAIEPYADYLIASEETEPSDGWYYSNFVKALDVNTSIATVDLAKQIIDDYVSHSLSNYRNSELTLSVIDLGELVHNISKPLATFSKSVADKLSSDKFQEVANDRGNTKEFSRGAGLDQIDLVDLALNFDVDGSKELVDAIKSSIKYNKTANITDSYGLSAYFPYSSLSKMNDMVKIYDNINIDDEYTNVVKSFATYASSGQVVTNNSGSSNTSIFDILMDNNQQSTIMPESVIFDLLTDSYYNNYYGSYGNNYDSFSSIFGGGYDSWLDPSCFRNVASYISKGKLVDTNKLKVTQKDGENVVSLEESQWELIENILLNVYVDDGKGYIDMGLDNVYEWNKDGDLIVDYDGTWLSINNHFIPYYVVSELYIDENNYKIVGKTPAYLNKQRVDIMISFTPENPYGIVEGAKFVYDQSDEQTKGLVEIKEGDVLEFICKYYRYDGTFESEYRLGDSYIVDAPLELNNIYLDNKYVYTYCFNDIYGNKLWTPKNSN